MNRRDFVFRSTAATAGIGLATLGQAAINNAAVGWPESSGPFKVVFDARFDAARAFATGAERRGWPVHAIEGDVTALWLYELQPRWAAGDGTVVGLTTERSLLCLEQLAWDQWMRVVTRRASRGGLADSLVSWVIAPG